jgi:hypothetical protein
LSAKLEFRWQYAVERIRDHALQEKETKKQLKEAQKQFEDYRFRGLRHENIDVSKYYVLKKNIYFR